MDTARRNSLNIINRLQALVIGLMLTLPASSQEVTVMVNPVQQVLPPQAGLYLTNPGRFFTIQLYNNTDKQQLVHLGLQILQLFPNPEELWVSTDMESGHIPRQPITLAPNQHKTLNAVEMSHLFDHFTSEDIYLKDDRYLRVTDGNFGLLPEGQYEAFFTAYKWDPNLTSKEVLSIPTQGNCTFNICYEAEPPKFVSPVMTDFDGGFDPYKVVMVDKNDPTFEWQSPTLNCNASMVTFHHAIRFVELNSLNPDEAMLPGVPIFHENSQLRQNRYTIPPIYVQQMIEPGKAKGKVYAVQLTATTDYFNSVPGSVNFTLLKNGGKSPILLFQLYDPNILPELTENPQKDDPNEGGGKPEDDGYTLELDGSDSDLEKEDSLYIFEQPIITQPAFSGKLGRKIYVGNDINAEWRKAWFAGGKGEEQDTVKFKYTIRLYTGNSADSYKSIIEANKFIYESTTTELKQTIKWDDIKEKIDVGGYYVLRVTAESTNEKSIRMLGDSLNHKDFAITQEFNETYKCGRSTATVTNKTLISKKPASNEVLRIGQWKLSLDNDYESLEFDEKEHTLKGKGWISWNPGSVRARIAVKFEGLKVNTDYQVFEGECKTYAKSSEKVEGTDCAVDELLGKFFDKETLDDIYGNLFLSEDVRKKVSQYITGDKKDGSDSDSEEDEEQSLAKGYSLGKYYSYYQKVDGLVSSWKEGNFDFYFPLEAPDEIKQYLPSDFNLQIANMTFSPSSAVMNLIGEIVLPNSDIFDDQAVLVFGAPRLCIQPDRLFPEDGVLALLSNFPIKDPNSDFKLVFKAPKDALNPNSHDGCFIRWENDKFDALGLEIAMTLPNTKRIVNNKVTDLPALLDLRATVNGGDDACDFIASGSLTAFQVNDLPDWKFGNSEDGGEMKVIFDHNLSDNDDDMPSLDDIANKFPSKTFDASLCGNYVASDWRAWQGVYISDLSVEFPKFAVFGSQDKGLSIGARNMIIDASGVTCQVFTDNAFEAQTGSCGGWAFSIKSASVDIIQNNFDNCKFSGGFGVPLFGKKADEKADKEAASKGKEANNKKVEDYTDFTYLCEIRHLTDPKEEKYYTWNAEGTKKDVERIRRTYEKSRYAYLFTTEPVDQLQLNCFIASVDFSNYKAQNYFLVESRDKKDESGQDTQVELCMAGDITIAGTDNANDRLKALSEQIGIEKLKLELPGIHFIKMRLSNKPYEQWEDFGIGAADRRQAAKEEQDKTIAEWNKKILNYNLAKENEIELSKDECYFNIGEWSLASERKKIGPFSFNIIKFEPSYNDGNLSLDVEGDIGLIKDKICVGGGISIAAKLHKEGSIQDWYLSDGDVDFKSLDLKIDFTSLVHMEGHLNLGDNGKGDKADKGYSGSLTFDITGLFSIECAGGYYNHVATEADKAEMKNEGDGNSTDVADENFSWGYFTANIESGAGIPMGPVTLNRIGGGFYFNCKPQKGEGATKESANKFSGDPVPQYGMIGVAFGIGMSAVSGESTLKGDVDLLVAYDRKNSCLTTFMFNGKMEAVGGIINSEVTLIYENSKDKVGKTIDRYLCLNISLEAGFANDALRDKMIEANEKLKEAQEELNRFSDQMGDLVNKTPKESSEQSLEALSEDDNPEKTAEREAEKTAEDKKKEQEQVTHLGSTGSVRLPIELKITWVEASNSYSTPRWHLYLGQPKPDKRCRITFINYEHEICSAHLKADAYLCLGNELPDNGKLPDIPQKITEFLSGHKNENTDMGGDLSKAQSSRMNATKALLNPNDIKGGVMVGASAWGDITLNLGLIYGGIEAIAGFDASLINYGNSAFCVNNHSTMGYEGWYALGQFYAYLAANLGIHVKIGSLIDKKISLIEAGIGGVLEVGLPKPTWIEGKARVKISLLSGLFSINRQFHFAAGDHCVPFRGNALDGFELFAGVSMGSDSLYQALYKPEFAISKADVNKMIVTTNASLGSHHRLVDPTYASQMAEDHYKDVEITDSIRDRLRINASRTYVFDMKKDENLNHMKMGIRLVDLGVTTTSSMIDEHLTPDEFYRRNGWNPKEKTYYTAAMPGISEASYWETYDNFNSFIFSQYRDRTTTVEECSSEMKGSEITSEEKGLLHQKTNITEVIDYNRARAKYKFNGEQYNYYQNALYDPKVEEKDVSFREDKGQTFHLCNMDVEEGHSYALILTGDAYEINNGHRVWCEYVDTLTMKEVPMRWRQNKIWFFRVKDQNEDKVEADSLSTLEPYVALAYPSVDGIKVKNNSNEPFTAYYGDILHPTIALNRNLTSDLPADKLDWILTAYDAKELAQNPIDSCWSQVQTVKAVYDEGNNCINLRPETDFSSIRKFSDAIQSQGSSYDYSNELYHLQLGYHYRPALRNKNGNLMKNPKTGTIMRESKDTTIYLVDLWVTAAPHGVIIKGMSGTQDDSWMQSTKRELTGELLPYVVPFVGASPTSSPVFNYTFKNDNDETLTDDEIAFQNYPYKDKDENVVAPYRLIDPWLYLSYLSKYTFIGDQALKSYDFDEMYIPFASESLIYEFNGTIINSDFIKGEEAMPLRSLRDEMYNTWNTWHFNNSNQPKWPLPMSLKSMGGITAANQNGRASTVSPRLLNINKNDQSYSYAEMARDFYAPFHVAETLSEKLKEETRDMFKWFSYSWDDSKEQMDDKQLNQLMRDFNEYHRGQYIEVTERGVTVRVPYYQLPLIFGGAFGDDSNTIYKTKYLNSLKRGFKSSIQNKDNKETRYDTDISNLLFYRLLGTDSYTAPISATEYVQSNPLLFKRSYKSEYAGSYSGNYVPQDAFNSYLSLKEVSQFEAASYRVDSYNLETGYYEMNNRAAEPWIEFYKIGTDGSEYKNMSELEDHLNNTDRDKEMYLDRPVPQLIWTEGNSTMTLLYSDRNYKKGDKLSSITITDLWRGENCMNASQTSNLNMRTNATKFVIDSSMKNAYISDMNSWFFAYSKLRSISGLQYLNTTNVTDMSNLFNGCGELETLDLTKLNTSNVRNMERMFSQCSKLQTLKQNFDTKNVTNMSYMFYQCESLTSLNLTNFKDDKVINTAAMFQRCSNLKSLNISQFKGNSVENTIDMFYGCKVLENIDIRSFGGFNIQACSNMFVGCEKLNTLHIEKFSPDHVGENDCINMFAAVNQSLNSYVAYDLIREIYVQIPGRRNISNHPNKIILAQNKQNQYELLFTKTSKTLNVGSTYDIEGKKTVYEGMKVQKVWNYSDIQNTTNSIPWASYKSSLVRVTIDPSFVPDSKTLIGNSDFSVTDQIVTIKNWFAGCRNVVSIDGLNNLYIKEVEDMSLMFENCEKLETLDIGNIDMYSVRNIKDMFKGCTSLKKLRMKLDLTEISDLSGFFSGLKSLETLEFSGVDVFGVKNMDRMFYGCENLKSLDLSDFNTIYRTSESSESNLTSMLNMFEGCKKLESIKWGRNFYTGKVKNFSRLFASCSSLKELDLSNIDTRSATNMQEIFMGCSSLRKLFIGNWSTENVQNMNRMFSGCTSLNDLNIAGFNTAKMTQCSEMFKGVPYQCTIYIPYDISTQIHPNQVKKPTYPNLVIIYPAQVIRYKDGSGESLVFLSSETKYSAEKKSGYQNTWNGHEITWVWSGMDVLNAYKTTYPGWANEHDYISVKIDPSFANVYPLVTKGWFMGMKVKSIDGLEYLNTSKVTDMSGMFGGCMNLTSLDLSHFDTSSVTRMSTMFYNCFNLTSLDLSNFNTSNVREMIKMFEGCHSLKSLDLSHFDTSNVIHMENMFMGCLGLTSLDVSNFNTEKVEYMAGIFSCCAKLSELNLKSFNTTKLTDVMDLFSGDENLRKLWLGNDFNLLNAKDYGYETGANGYNGPLGSYTYNYYDVDYKSVSPKSVRDLYIIVPAEKLQQYRSQFTNKLGFMEGKHGWIVTEGPRAIWTQDNNTLTFTNHSPVSKVGDDFNGHKVSSIWSAEQLTNSPEHNAPAWAKTVTRNNATVADEGSVYGKVTTVVIDESFKEMTLHSTSHWFHLGNQLKTINGLENLNTSEVESMEWMFATCGISKFDGMNLNTSNVKSMEGMFAESLITTIDNIDNFDTQNVENMANMFSGCANLQSAKFVKMKTQNVTDMSGMFRNCVTLNDIDLQRFNWSKVDDISEMFYGCSALETLRLRKFDPNAIAINRFSNVFKGVAGVKVLIDEFESGQPNLRSDFAKMGFTKETGTIIFKNAQAIWTEGNNTLTFVCNKENPAFVPNDDFNGHKVTSVWNESDISNTPVEDGKVPWTETVQGKVKRVVFDDSFKDVRLQSTAYWFADYTNSTLSEITGINNLYTVYVKDMSGMFLNCGELKNLDLTGLVLKSVEFMKDMFRGCEALKSMEFKLYTGIPVTDMSGMFYNCRRLETINLRMFKDAPITTMKDMFRGCDSLKTLDVLGINTLRVTDMSGMFADCGLKNINIHEFKTNNVVNADMMFYNSSVKSLNVGLDFNLSKMTTATDVFNGVTDLVVTIPNPSIKQRIIDILGFVEDTNGYFVILGQKVAQVIWTEDNTTLTFMYSNNVNVGDDINGHVVTKVWNLSKGDTGWYRDTEVKEHVTTVEIHPTFYDFPITNTSNWFKLGEQLTTINGLEYLNTQRVQNMEGMFSGCGVESLDLRSFNTSIVTKMNSMFYNCQKLKTVILDNFITSNVVTMNDMFANCRSLTSLNLSGFSTGKLTSMSHMFLNCYKLMTLDLSNFNTQSVTDMTQLFANCYDLEKINLKNFNMSKVINLSYMFYKCNHLKTLELTRFDVSSTAIKMSKDVFTDVTGLKIYLSSNEYPTATKKQQIQQIFKNLQFNSSNTNTISFVK